MFQNSHSGCCPQDLGPRCPAIQLVTMGQNAQNWLCPATVMSSHCIIRISLAFISTRSRFVVSYSFFYHLTWLRSLESHSARLSTLFLWSSDISHSPCSHIKERSLHMPQDEFRKHSVLSRKSAETVANEFARKTSCHRSHAGRMLPCRWSVFQRAYICPQRWKLDLGKGR